MTVAELRAVYNGLPCYYARFPTLADFRCRWEKAPDSAVVPEGRSYVFGPAKEGFPPTDFKNRIIILR